MTPRTARLVRGGLLVVLVGVSGVVVLSLRRPGKRPAAVPLRLPRPHPCRKALPSVASSTVTVKTDKDGNVRDSFVVRAQSMEGKDGEEQRLRGVEVNLTYMAKGEPGKATIVADQGLYAPAQQKAVFRGHVHVTTEDGMDLKTEQLIYRGDHNSVKSDTHVEFKRKDLSGTAQGVHLRQRDGPPGAAGGAST